MFHIWLSVKFVHVSIIPCGLKHVHLIIIEVCPMMSKVHNLVFKFYYVL